MGSNSDSNKNSTPNPEMLKNLDLLLDGEILKYEKDWTLLGDKTPSKEIEMAGKMHPADGAENRSKKENVIPQTGGHSRDQ